MFGLFTKIFKGSASKQQDSPNRGLSKEASTLSTAAAARPSPAPGSAVTAGDSITVPFSAILQSVPQELHGKMTAAGLAGFNFTIPKATVLEQLPQGSVKVPLGDLRNAAPAGVFVSGSSHDGKPIDLPLGEIMSQLDASAFARNPSQRRVEAPAEIGDLFNGKGEPLSQVRVLPKNEIPKTATTFLTKSAAAPAVPVATVVKPIAPVAPIVVAPVRTPVAVAAPAIKMPPPSSPPIPAVPPAAPAALAPSAPIPFPKPAAPAAPAAPVQKPKVFSPPAPAAAAPKAVSMPSLVVPLAAIADNWPETIRTEIGQAVLTTSKCALPLEEIGSALKTGKVQFQWKRIRSWLTPPISGKGAPSNAETTLDLPLKVIAPLYMEQCRSVLSGKKVSVAEGIPDVFSKVQKPLAPPPPAPESAPPPAIAVEAPAPVADEPVAAAVATAPAAGQPAVLSLPLSLVCGNWPDQVRKEMETFHLTDAKLEVPFPVIEEGLKQGRLHFRWKEVCRWLKPAPPAAMTSANLNTQVDYRVDLPLNFVAPVFMQHRSGAAAKKPASSLASIPDVFSATRPEAAGAAHPEPAAAVSAPSPAPPAAKPAQDSDSKPARKPGEDLAELFGEPGKKNWTPNDIVHKTATLPGVAGALIALQDGLLVANCLPPDWKTETIAAFLPQIFGRMTQYTNELKMGQLQSVTFTVDQGTLQIFNAGIIYFAVLGRLDTPLPLAELNLIVKEISRHTK